ncbi:hypothetical protein PV08_03373 [Exophiala spinifera]|uniref:Uncharacterized protein n=1 Tax=Exophiala spinifera TaxID=91928 RepID=A0A0D1YUY9_9EURO|nr:uncharacterized protein PV08_03373 [Exophiala spinifera]KIW19081.1 hypothetical protein PV08_03373 [Exophiala spinifera]
MDKATEPNKPSKGVNTNEAKDSFPSSAPPHYVERANRAFEMAKRISGGANLQTVAGDYSMTTEQVCQMIAMFAVQAGEIGKATLGSCSLTTDKSYAQKQETMNTIIGENKEGTGKAIQDQCEQVKQQTRDDGTKGSDKKEEWHSKTQDEYLPDGHGGYVRSHPNPFVMWYPSKKPSSGK